MGAEEHDELAVHAIHEAPVTRDHGAEILASMEDGAQGRQLRGMGAQDTCTAPVLACLHGMHISCTCHKP